MLSALNERLDCLQLVLDEIKYVQPAEDVEERRVPPWTIHLYDRGNASVSLHVFRHGEGYNFYFDSSTGRDDGRSWFASFDGSDKDIEELKRDADSFECD